MIVQSPFRHAARVEMHLPGGFTRVILFELSERRWEIPTDRIPLQLRRIGSEFFVVMPRFTVETSDTPEALRELCQQVHIEELHEPVPSAVE
jgi:hypothetical protein